MNLNDNYQRVSPPGLEVRWEHDCTYCKHLGTAVHRVNKDEAVDYYICLAHRPTLIARMSNEPADYISGMPSVFSDIHLMVALALAVQQKHFVVTT